MLLRVIHDFLRSCQPSRCCQILFNWLFPCSFQSDEFFICRIFSGGLIILIGLASRWIKSNSSSFCLYLTRANKQDPQSFKLYFIQVQNSNSYILWLAFLSWKFKFETLFSTVYHVLGNFSCNIFDNGVAIYLTSVPEQRIALTAPVDQLVCSW